MLVFQLTPNATVDAKHMTLPFLDPVASKELATILSMEIVAFETLRTAIDPPLLEPPEEEATQGPVTTVDPHTEPTADPINDDGAMGDDSNTNVGTIAGGVVAAVILVGFVAAVLIVCHKKQTSSATAKHQPGSVADVEHQVADSTDYFEPVIERENAAFPERKEQASEL